MVDRLATGANFAQSTPPQQGQLTQRVVESEVTAAEMESNTFVLQMIPVRAKEVVYDVILQCDDLDGSTGLIFDVGDGDVVDRYIDGAAVPQTGGTHQFAQAAGVAPSEGEWPREYTENDTIDVKVAVVATTGVAGTIRLIALIG